MPARPSTTLDSYFKRIRYGGDARPTPETLARIHALHAEHIPFENLAAFLGEPIPLDIDALRAKLLERGRGGWCFEQNILLSHVLAEIGFGVKWLAARVRLNAPPGKMVPRSHMILLVAAGGRDYICDVGFGGQSQTAPLRLDTDLEQATPHEPYRIRREGDGYLLEAKIAGAWQDLYVFDLREEHLVDYERSNWYLSHHPESHFVTGVVAARAEPGRRHALRNTRYAIHRADGSTEKRFVTSVREYKELLAGPLAIRLPDAPDLDAKLEKLIAANPPTA